MTIDPRPVAATVEPTRGSHARAREVLRQTGALGNALTRALARRLGDPALASNETVLLVSALAERGPLRPRDLLPVTGVTSGGMTRQLDRLESLGLVERSLGEVPGDRRAIRVALTDAGRRTADLMAAVVDDETHRLRTFLDAVEELLGPRPATEGPAGTSIGQGPVGSAAAPPGGAMRRLLLLGTFGTEVHQAVLQAGADVDLVRNLPVAVLCELDERGSARPTDLMRASGLSSGGLTKLLDRLEERGLVERQHGAVKDDRRATLVSITLEGSSLVDRFAGKLADRRATLLRLTLAIRSTLDAGP